MLEVAGTVPTKPVVRTAAPHKSTVPDEAMWPRVTREVADDLAADAIARDRAGKPPYDEVARLREAGLPALLTPPVLPGRNLTGPASGPSPDPDDPGGHVGGGHGGADWRTAAAVIREIAAADGSIGELIARHYVLSWSSRFFGTTGETWQPDTSRPPSPTAGSSAAAPTSPTRRPAPDSPSRPVRRAICSTEAGPSPPVSPSPTASSSARCPRARASC